jgi:serine/threonine protein kinase
MKRHDPGGRKLKWYKPWRYIPRLRRKTPKTPQFQSPITDYTPTQIPTDVPPNVPLPDRDVYKYTPDLMSQYYCDPRYAFGEEGSLNYHIQVLRDNGFKLYSCIIKVEDDLFDNQIWNVESTGAEPERYAMKVASFVYYELGQELETKRTVYETVCALYKECRTLMFLNHENIIRVVKVFGLPDPDTRVDFLFHCMVMEKLDESLQELQRLMPGHRIPDDMSREWFQQIAVAVDYLHNDLHNKNVWISHLAIKPENIMCRRRNPRTESRVYKPIDFEESMCFNTGDKDSLPDSHLGNFNNWSAMELKHKAVNYPTKAMDVFSLGLSLATTMLARHQPRYFGFLASYNPKIKATKLSFNNLTPEEQTIFLAISVEASVIFAETLQNSHLRPTIAQVLQMDFCKP